MDAVKKIEEILKEHDIKIEINGCGCCGSPWVSFEYKGERIIDNEFDFYINMFNDKDT